MPFSPSFFEVCRCPLTGQKLREAPQEVVDWLESNRRGKTLVVKTLQPQIDLTRPILAALIREDGKVCYVVQDDLAVLLPDHAVEIKAT